MPDESPSSDPITTRQRPVLHGVDVSVYQGHIDWIAVAAAGVSFAIVKASQRERDPLFAEHWNGARAVGLKVGLYHYLDPKLPVSQQLELFLETYRGVEGFADLPPALDVEEAGREETPDGLVTRALAWIWAIKEELDVTPIVYTYTSFAERYMRTERALDLAACPLWIAHHGVEVPRIPAPWSRWALWQHTDAGRVEGIRGRVDLNCMRPEAFGLVAEAAKG